MAFLRQDHNYKYLKTNCSPQKYVDPRGMKVCKMEIYYIRRNFI
jgi:hypothetical protein